MPRQNKETVYKSWATRYDANKILCETRNGQQQHYMIENNALGRMLFLDSITQVTEIGKFIYHEMFIHVPLLAHGAVHRVLIIGGDSGMAKEVLKHPSVNGVTMVEIDLSVVDTTQKCSPSINSGAFNDQRLELVYAGGAQFVAETEQRYDVAIVDSSDPIRPGKALFSEAFYRNCRRLVGASGILVVQNGIPILQPEKLRVTMGLFWRIFAAPTCYRAAIPVYVGGEYVGGEMAFGWGSDDSSLLQVPVETLADRYAQAGIETRYYTPELHSAAFALPTYIRDLLGSRSIRGG